MFTCPYCGGEAIDESGNDALVCTECGRLFSLDEAFDDERETAEAEKRVMGQLMAEQDAVERRIRKFRFILWSAVVILCVAVISICVVKYVVDGNNEYKDYPAPRVDWRVLLTEEVLAEEYKAFYGARSDGKLELIVIAAVTDIAIIVIGLLASALIPIWIRKQVLGDDEKGNAMVAFMISFFLILISVFTVAIYKGRKNISPKNAKYCLYKIDYKGKYIEQDYTYSENSSDYTYVIRYYRDGYEIKKTVSQEEYNIFPNTTGKYYIAEASDGNSRVIFHAYEVGVCAVNMYVYEEYG